MFIISATPTNVIVLHVKDDEFQGYFQMPPGAHTLGEVELYLRGVKQTLEFLGQNYQELITDEYLKVRET